MLKIHPEVLNALQNNLPVVALESTIISHGLPRPRNHQAALDFEQILRDKGVVPATIAVIGTGLDRDVKRRIVRINGKDAKSQNELSGFISAGAIHVLEFANKEILSIM